MKKWEYKVIDGSKSVFTPNSEVEERLNDFGTGGWELVTTFGNLAQKLIFKRESK